MQEEQGEVVQSVFAPKNVQKHCPPFYAILFNKITKDKTSKNIILPRHKDIEAQGFTIFEYPNS